MKLRQIRMLLFGVFFLCLAVMLIGLITRLRYLILLGMVLACFLYLPLDRKLWRCPVCGEHLGRGRPEFCPHCGALLPDDC